MFYGIFMALCCVLISMSIFTFKVCWEISCGEAFYFVETIQLIQDASQVNGFYMVWVFTVKNTGADYHSCCFVLTLIKCHVM